MIALLAAAIAASSPTPSPALSPLPSGVVQWYAQRGAIASGLDPALVRAVIDAESGGDPRAVSGAGAVGMMQLASGTASDCGIRDRFDPLANVECGARTLGYLIRRFGMEGGIAAYNFGSGNVEASGGHVSKMPHETQAYVKTVIDGYDALQHEVVHAVAPAQPRPQPQPQPLQKARVSGELLAADQGHPDRLLLRALGIALIAWLALGAEALRKKQNPTRTGMGRVEMEPLTGIEPVAFSLPRRCSTTELQRRG